MLLALFHEIMRRRLWPIPVAALLIAVAAPLLFLKSPDDDSSRAAHASQVIADTSTADGLPVRARRLLRTSAPKPHVKKRPKAADPFEPPGSVGEAKSDASPTSTSSSAPASSSAATAKQEPVPVVITGPDGKATSTPDSNGSDGTAAAASGAATSHVAVEVRVAKSGGHARRTLAPLQPLSATGLLVASFVKYSPGRNKAVFAISPNTLVTGSVECRKVDGLCRYVDLGAGKHVLLTIAGSKGALVTRRLSVVRIHTVSGASDPPPLAGACLFRKLQKLGPGDPAVLIGACD